MSMDRFTKAEFTSNGTWTAPAGVTRILIWGMGGGAGGCGGGRGSLLSGTLFSFGGRGGSAVSLQPYVVTVVPNTTYTITIGAGGTGGAGGTSGFGGSGGGSGGATIFGNSIIEWKGAIMSQVAGSAQIIPSFSFYNSATFTPINQPIDPYEFLPTGGTQGNGSTSNRYGTKGFPGRLGASATSGNGAGSGSGGSGGSGMSGEDVGGVGGTGAPSSVGGAGGNAPANSGSGGGGGAGGANGFNGGAGGNGGSGKMIIMWVE